MNLYKQSVAPISEQFVSDLMPTHIKHKKLRIIHFGPIDTRRITGLSRSIPALVKAQRELGVDARLVHTSGHHAPKTAEVVTSEHNREIKRGNVDLVVFHSTYIVRHVLLSLVARRSGVPYVITPRGGMTIDAHSRAPFKKLVANILFFNKMVRSAAAIHYLSEGERDRSAHWSGNSFVVGNGVDEVRICQRPWINGDQLRILYVGRLDCQQKGIDVLLRGCMEAQSSDPSIVSRCLLEVYGPFSTRGDETLIRRLCKPVSNWVKLKGPVDDVAKEQLFARSHIFIHTSRFEGMPMAVLEALSRGLPCILTPGTMIADDVCRAGAGIKVAFDAKAIGDKIKAVCDHWHGLAQMSASATEYAQSITWPKIAERTVGEYRRLLSNKPLNP